MTVLTDDQIEAMYKKMLPHFNALSEIAKSYIPDKDFRGSFSLGFKTDGSFLLVPPIGDNNQLIRLSDEDFPSFIDDDGDKHQMVKENGRIKWQRTKE